jgi:FdhD protein
MTLIGRAKGSRFIALAGTDRIVYDADAREVVEEGRRQQRKASIEEP